MAGDLVLPPGAAAPAEGPKWAPKEHDYVERDRLCPFSSVPWGAVFNTGRGLGQAAGLTYVRCNRLCSLFIPASDDDPKDTKNKARGSCSLSRETTT